MGLFGKKTEVDRKLKRRQMVTTDEIYETYVEQERSPWGSVTQSPESVKRALDKIMEATRLGLLVESDGTDTPTSAREAAIGQLNGESIEAEAEIKDVGPLTPNGASAHMVASAGTVAWALLERPDAVGSMLFEQVTTVVGEGGRLKLTQRDPEYAAELQDPGNPYGETDGSFLFPETQEAHALYETVTARLKAVSAAYAGVRGTLTRLLAAEGQPVATWAQCPVCEATIISRVDHGALCAGCEYCFTDPNFEPILSEDEPLASALVGTKSWRPLMETQLEYRNRLMLWVLRPPGQPIGPPYVMAAQIMDAMREGSTPGFT